MTAGELIELLGQVDPEAVMTLRDGENGIDLHIRPGIRIDQFTVTLYAGRVVTEEDLA